MNLSLAAWGLPLSAWGDPNANDVSDLQRSALRWFSRHAPTAIDALPWLAWIAPLAILLATSFVWAEDVKRSSRGRAAASSAKAMLARLLGPAAISGEILLLGVLAGAFFLLHGGPHGLLFGTLSISLSAMAFLGFISWLRNRTPPIGLEASLARRVVDDRRQQREIDRFTFWLFAIAFLVALAVWVNPTNVGRFLGSMVVAYFAFGAMLALVNFCEFAIQRATDKQWFGKTAKPRVVGAYAVAFVIGVAVLNAWLHPFHRVRLCDDDCEALAPHAAGFSVATLPNERPTVADAASAWYDQAAAAHAKAHGGGPVPMLIVASAGGGIRAAFWTATVLERLEKDFASEGGVRPYLFAISGVSGGSVGGAAFEAALTKRDESHCMAGDKGCQATDLLTEDFLAPALASWIFVDTPSSFLPDLRQDDRGAALERSFEHASGGVLARPFLSFFRLRKGPAPNGEPAPWWRPMLLLNATHEQTGKRIITSHVLIERNVFLDSFDALKELRKDIRASTAAENSARFTYVSPAGDLGNHKGSVIDGGYFENYGALSALEVARAAKKALKDKTPGVNLVILMISSDPGLDRRARVRINRNNKADEDRGKCLVSIAERESARSGGASDSSPNYFSLDGGLGENPWVNQFLAPFEGINNVRGAHGNLAAAELAGEICTESNESQKNAFGTQPTQQPVQTQIAETFDNSKYANLDDSHSLEASPNGPYFAHLAMCTERPGKPSTLKPPLGWVLSKATQDAFKQQRLFNQCGNDDQLRELEIALGKEAPRQVVGSAEPKTASSASP
jgi:hypothetical protein